MLTIQLTIDAQCITPKVLEELSAQVINQLNEEPDDLLRYVVANTLNKAFALGASNAGAQAEAYCQKNDIGWDGKDFEHKGYWFNRQANYEEPNYAGNATDENGDPVAYTEHLRAVEKAELALKAKKLLLSADELLIENAHPNMKRTLKSVTFKLMRLFGVKKCNAK